MYEQHLWHTHRSIALSCQVSWLDFAIKLWASHLAMLQNLLSSHSWTQQRSFSTLVWIVSHAHCTWPFWTFRRVESWDLQILSAVSLLAIHLPIMFKHLWLMSHHCWWCFRWSAMCLVFCHLVVGWPMPLLWLCQMEWWRFQRCSSRWCLQPC